MAEVPSFGDPRLPARFWAKVAVDPSGCWLWTAGRVAGYAAFWHGSAMARGHRIAYAALVGPPPDMLDHVRCPRHCVNPAHVREATPKQNGENRQTAYGASGVRGVYWDKRTEKWRGQLVHNGRNYHTPRTHDRARCEADVKALRNELFTHNHADREVAHA